MPYALKGRCVIQSDTGAIIKCHPTRTRAQRHLAALMINVPEAKALPTGTAGGTGRTRSEAAIEAWKHRQRAAPQTPGGLSPKIAARVKEILAAKQKKGKPKAKAKARKGPDPAKVKASAAKKAEVAKAKAERVAKQATAKQERDKTKAERATPAIVKKQERDKAKIERVAAQAKKQQAAQQKMKQAAAKQKTKAKASAQAKTERAKQTQAKQSATQQRKTRVLAEKVKRGEKLSASDQVDAEDAGLINAGKAMTDLAIKAGARHSMSDQQHIQGIHDHSVACGANCDTGDDATPDEQDMEDAGKAIKGIMDNPLYYAQHECSDIMQAANALSTMAMLISSELAEDDEDPQHIDMLCDAVDTLIEFIQSEVDELRSAAKDAAHDAGMGPMKAITAREDISPADKKRAVAEYGDVTYADEKNKKYPLSDETKIRAAWNYISKEANAAKYDPDEVTQIKAKIVSAWKKLIDKAGPPSAQSKAWDLPHIDGDAIKALDNDMIRGYAVRFGDADHPDLQKDYYTKSTDFWLDHFGWPRPITYHHGMDAGTRNDPVIGHWLKAGVDDVGVWMEGQMDRAHAYYKAMKELAQRGYLRLSSDSAPQWVIREKQQNGVNEIKRWPLITSSCTVTPMEPRMLPVEVKAYLAEIGFDAIDEDTQVDDPDLARSDATKASDEDRARAILLELDLLELETA